MYLYLAEQQSFKPLVVGPQRETLAPPKPPQLETLAPPKPPS